MFDGIKKKAKKVIEAGKEAVETKYMIVEKGEVIAKGLSKKEIYEKLFDKYGIEIGKDNDD